MALLSRQASQAVKAAVALQGQEAAQRQACPSSRTALPRPRLRQRPAPGALRNPPLGAHSAAWVCIPASPPDSIAANRGVAFLLEPQTWSRAGTERDTGAWRSCNAGGAICWSGSAIASSVRRLSPVSGTLRTQGEVKGRQLKPSRL